MEDHAKTNTLLENADALARFRLSEERYGHTLRVADTVGDLTRVHGLDRDRGRLAALLHDAARETGPEEFLRLAGKWDLPIGEPERQSPKLLHGPVAAELARRELGEALADPGRVSVHEVSEEHLGPYGDDLSAFDALSIHHLCILQSAA